MVLWWKLDLAVAPSRAQVNSSLLDFGISIIVFFKFFFVALCSEALLFVSFSSFLEPFLCFCLLVPGAQGQVPWGLVLSLLVAAVSWYLSDISCHLSAINCYHSNIHCHLGDSEQNPGGNAKIRVKIKLRF